MTIKADYAETEHRFWRFADDTPELVTWSRPVIHPANPDPLFTERLVLVIHEGARP